MNRDHDAAGHLLFGLLALQTGLIDQAQLVAAFHAWTRDKARPLADHLVALGTPAYMSPEQARGDLEHLGPRSDVYSLGATLYCLLTGRPPVERDDVGAVLRAVQQGDFPPPRSLDPSVNRALEALCLKAMALRPEDRYGSARELAEDVERWAADQPVTAWPEPILRRARRWARRHKPLVACAAVLLAATVIALVAGTILLSRANSRTEKQRQVAEANYRRAAPGGGRILHPGQREQAARCARPATAPQGTAGGGLEVLPGLPPGAGRRPRRPGRVGGGLLSCGRCHAPDRLARRGDGPLPKLLRPLRGARPRALQGAEVPGRSGHRLRPARQLAAHLPVPRHVQVMLREIHPAGAPTIQARTQP